MPEASEAHLHMRVSHAPAVLDATTTIATAATVCGAALPHAQHQWCTHAAESSRAVPRFGLNTKAGDTDGRYVGRLLGGSEGTLDGGLLGPSEGYRLGRTLGVSVGHVDGWFEGECVG